MEKPNRDVIIFVAAEDAETVANPLAERLRELGEIVLVISAEPHSWTAYLAQISTWSWLVVFIVNERCAYDELFLRELRVLNPAQTRPLMLAVLHDLDDDLMRELLTSLKIGAVPTIAGQLKIVNLIKERLTSVRLS